MANHNHNYRRSLLIAISLIVIVSSVNSFDYGPTDRLLSTDPLSPYNYAESKAYPNVTVSEKWMAIAKFYNDYAWPHRTKIIHFIKKAIKEPSLKFSPECVRGLKLFGKGLRNEVQWAYEGKYQHLATFTRKLPI